MENQLHPCPLHGTTINRICLHSDCQTQLLCSQCSLDQHNNHLSDIINFDQIPICLKNENIYLKSIKYKFDLLISKVQEFVLVNQNRITQLQECTQNLNDINIEKLKRYCLVHYDIDNGYIKLKTHLAQWDIQLDHLLNSFQVSQKCQLWLFSHKYKHQDIQILHPNRILKEKCKTSNSLCLIEPSFVITQQQVIYFQINKLMTSIAIGLCDQQIVKNKKYTFQNWSELGHGCYMISCSGYCYNSDKEDLNFKQNSFKFSSGAKLRMIFDPQNNNLSFLLLGQNLEYEMKVEMEMEMRSLYPCVYLSKGNEDVEIYSFLGF